MVLNESEISIGAKTVCNKMGDFSFKHDNIMHQKASKAYAEW